jgi:hypothetical protein
MPPCLKLDNNNASTKHEFKVKYEGYLFINKILAKAHFKCNLKKMKARNNTFLQKNVAMKLLEVSLSCLHFSLMFFEGEVKSSCFLQVW